MELRVEDGDAGLPSAKVTAPWRLTLVSNVPGNWPAAWPVACVVRVDCHGRVLATCQDGPASHQSVSVDGTAAAAAVIRDTRLVARMPATRIRRAQRTIRCIFKRTLR